MIYIIAALNHDYIIGKDGHLPWHIPQDLQYFKKLTTGHIVLMGRKTYESIGHALPNRQNWVLTHQNNFCTDSNISVFHSINEVFEAYNQNTDRHLFIIGGGEIYKQFLTYAHKLYLTFVDQVIEGDAFFPSFTDCFKLSKIIKQDNQAVQYTDDGIPFQFTVWKKIEQ